MKPDVFFCCVSVYVCVLHPDDYDVVTNQLISWLIAVAKQPAWNGLVGLFVTPEEGVASAYLHL